jgi:hypothetical protein
MKHLADIAGKIGVEHRHTVVHVSLGQVQPACRPMKPEFISPAGPRKRQVQRNQTKNIAWI